MYLSSIFWKQKLWWFCRKGRFYCYCFTCDLPYNILEKRSITDAGKLLVLVWVSVTSLLPTELPTARVGIFQAYVL